MAHRGTKLESPASRTGVGNLGFWLVPLAAVAALTACGADEGPVADGQPAGEPVDRPAVTEPAQTGLGSITTYAGSGSPQFQGDGGPAIEAGFYQPAGLALDNQGNLYLASDNRVRRIDAATQIITTVVGTGRNRSNGDGGPAAEAALAEPVGVAVDGGGNLFIVENGSGRIRKVDAASGIITTVAGGGIGDPRKKIFGDGGPATEAMIKLPTDVALDGSGNLYIATDNRVRKVDADSGVITTFAGIGERSMGGDGGPAIDAGLAEPVSIAIDSRGNVFFADRDNHRVRKVDGATGIITTVAGMGKHSKRDPEAYQQRSDIREVMNVIAAEGAGYSGDGGPAASAKLALPTDVALDIQGNLFITEGSVRVRRIDAATGVITTVASDEAVQTMEGGKVQVVTVTFGLLTSIAVNSTGEVFLADYRNNVVHRLSAPAAP